MTQTPGENMIDQSMIHQAVYLALVSPEPVLNRLALYESSEVAGRHTAAEMSILRYALAGYLTGVVNERGIEQPIIEPYDDSVDVTYASDETVPDTEINVEYPAWLEDFFESEDNFAYLQPINSAPLAEILDQMREFALDYAVPSSQEGAPEDYDEAQEADDSGEESAEADESAEIAAFDDADSSDAGPEADADNAEGDLARM